MTRASEGGHWYDRDATPRYEVMAKDGTMRPATLRDARKYGWYPGVTSIIKCAAAPGLEKWKQDQVLMAALTLPRVEGETSEALCARILADSGEQARKARERGTEIHAAIQGHFEGKAPSEELWPYVKGVLAALEANFGGRQEWASEVACVNPMGYGTKADLTSGDILIDFKGSDFDEIKAAKLETYDEHHMQLAATGAALRVQPREFAICYVSRTVPGLARIIRVDDKERQQGWSMFCALLDYWQAKNDYYPQRWKVAA